MIKDRGQKKLAAKHCAAQGMVPFVEVVVRSATAVDDMPVNVTDIDVAGIEIGRSGTVRRTIYDCKTANRQSGINRALWGAGLRHYIGAEAGFVIQVKAVPDSHRLAAAAMGINIHTEDSFRRYAASLSPDFLKDTTYLDDMDQWDDLLVSGRGNQAVSDLVFFVTSQAPLEVSGPKGVRFGISSIIRASGELDPRKPLHRLIYCSSLSAFMLHMALCVSSLKDIFDFGMVRADFEHRLRYFLWEGKENYELRLKLRRALTERSGTPILDGAADFDLPEWSKMVELVRGYLEAPEALTSIPLIIKEVGFRNTSKSKKVDADHRIGEMLRSNNRARQFIFSASSYFTNAAGLPKEFQKDLEDTINGLIE